MSGREKVLIALCGLVTVVMLLFTLVLEPKLNEVTSNDKQLRNLKQTNQQTEIEILRIQAQLKKIRTRKLIKLSLNCLWKANTFQCNFQRSSNI